MTTQTKLPRGRPRPPEAIERDRMILSLLRSGCRTRNEIRDRTGLSPSIVYLSLARLRRAGLVSLAPGSGADRVWSVRD